MYYFSTERPEVREDWSSECDAASAWVQGGWQNDGRLSVVRLRIILSLFRVEAASATAHSTCFLHLALHEARQVFQLCLVACRQVFFFLWVDSYTIQLRSTERAFVQKLDVSFSNCMVILPLIGVCLPVAVLAAHPAGIPRC